MATYKSSYTGPQIDQAVGNALVKDTTTLSNDVNHIPASSVVKSAITHDLANIVATGTTNTTGAAITTGKYFYLNGVLVQAIGSGISTGAPFTLNTNYKVVTAGGLNDLKAALDTVPTFLKISGTIGAVDAITTLYTHPSSLASYMIVGWDVAFSSDPNSKYTWQDDTIFSQLLITGTKVQLINKNAGLVGETMEVLLCKA